MSEAFSLCVEEGGERLDIYLSRICEITRSKAKHLIDGGEARLNGCVVKCGSIVKKGDVITLNKIEPPPSTLLPEEIPLDILYEDDCMIVLNKQCGLVVHPGGGAYSGTLVNALLYHTADLSGVAAGRPGIVHRLDKDTSGVMVVAKTDEAHLSLSKQIGEKTATRQYLALCEGKLKYESGTITANIVRDKIKRKEFTVCGAGEGRTATTLFDVVATYEGYSLVMFRLQTGRTHQIRVHAKYMGNPVVCDPVYGRKTSLPHKGQLLHSYRLSLSHPKTNKRLTFTAPLPEHFSRILSGLKCIEPPKIDIQ